MRKRSPTSEDYRVSRVSSPRAESRPPEYGHCGYNPRRKLLTRDLDFASSLPIDSNIALLEFPSTTGRLKYATFNTWKTEGAYFVNVGIIDHVKRTVTGDHFSIATVLGLNFVRIRGGLVAIGHDNQADIAIWEIPNEAEVLLYRYAVPDYPGDMQSPDYDSLAVKFIDSLGSEGKLVGYKRVMGADLQGLTFEG